MGPIQRWSKGPNNSILTWWAYPWSQPTRGPVPVGPTTCAQGLLILSLHFPPFYFILSSSLLPISLLSSFFLAIYPTFLISYLYLSHFFLFLFFLFSFFWWGGGISPDMTNPPGHARAHTRGYLSHDSYLLSHKLDPILSTFLENTLLFFSFQVNPFHLINFHSWEISFL